MHICYQQVNPLERKTLHWDQHKELFHENILQLDSAKTRMMTFSLHLLLRNGMYDKIYSMSHALHGMPKTLGENLRTIIVILQKYFAFPNADSLCMLVVDSRPK